MSCVSLYIGSLSGKGGEVNTHIYEPKMWRKKMNIRTPAACCHKHRSNNEVKWKTLMNTSTLPRSPTSLYIPVAGSKYTTVWWNKHSRTHTHSVRESPESWDWIKSFSPFSSSFHGFLPTEREEGRHSQSQRSEEWPSLTDCPGD